MRSTITNVASHMETLLKVYFVMTLLSILLDIVEFFIQLVRFGREGDVIYSLLIKYRNSQT